MHRTTPSPSKLSPCRRFTLTPAANRKYCVWDRQSRTNMNGIGTPRMLWKRFESGPDQIEEDVTLEEEESGQAADGAKVDRVETSPTKAVKKISLAGNEGVANVWDQGECGLIHKVPRFVADGTSTASGDITAPEPVHSEDPASKGAQILNSDQNTAKSMAESDETDRNLEVIRMTAHSRSLDTSLTADQDTASSEAAAPSLVATQVWTRARGRLRDDTASARAEVTTPLRKAKSSKPCPSPGAELDEITPLFLKRMFTVLNDAMAASSRRSVRPLSAPSSRGPTKMDNTISQDANRSLTNATPVQSSIQGEVMSTDEEMDAQGGSLEHADDAVVALKEVLDASLEDDVHTLDLLGEVLDEDKSSCTTR